jgi:hypothetical protein
MRKPTFLATEYRLVLAGDELEIKYFEKPIYYGFSKDPKVPIYHETEDDSRERSRYRATRRVRDLANANFGSWIDQFGNVCISKFLTLTFRDDVFLPKDANPEFKLYMKRLNYRIFKTKRSEIKYLATIEFMPDSRKLHYHILIFNLPYLDNFYQVFSEEWHSGFIWIEKVPNKNIGQYMTKYMTKVDDEKLRGQMSYLRSQALLEPTVILDHKFIAKIFRNLPYEAQVYATAYPSEHHGMTEMKKFSLEKYPGIKKFILANNPQSDTFKPTP